MRSHTLMNTYIYTYIHTYIHIQTKPKTTLQDQQCSNCLAVYLVAIWLHSNDCKDWRSAYILGHLVVKHHNYIVVCAKQFSTCTFIYIDLVKDASDCIFNLTRYLTLFIVTFTMAFVPDRYNGTCDTLFVISTAVNVLPIKLAIHLSMIINVTIVIATVKSISAYQLIT